MANVDWLSYLLRMITVTGRVEVRCVYGAPWQVARGPSAAHEIPYHVVLKGRAMLEDPETKTARELLAGDIVLLPHGSAQVLNDGSGHRPRRTCERQGPAGWTIRENGGQGVDLDMLCGRFFIAPPHDRLIRGYLPATLLVRGARGQGEDLHESALGQLESLVGLMRKESAADKPGGRAILNALALALFALTLRAAAESGQAPAGLLALAGHPRLAPAVLAMFADPARSWSVGDLAGLCGMSRATFMRHFRERLGGPAIGLLTDIRMSLAANYLKKPRMTTEAVSEAVGYRSVAAFRRVFTDRMGMTPGRWRRLAQSAR